MAYELHIEIEDNKISKEAWIAAVKLLSNLRITGANTCIANPVTGEKIVIPSERLDVEIKVKSKGFFKKPIWEKVFFFNNGQVSFRPNESMLEDSSHPVRQAASLLAKELNAQIIGDEGEVYDW